MNKTTNAINVASTVSFVPLDGCNVLPVGELDVVELVLELEDPVVVGADVDDALKDSIFSAPAVMVTV